MTRAIAAGERGFRSAIASRRKNMSPRLPFATYAVVRVMGQNVGIRWPSSGRTEAAFARTMPPRTFIAIDKGPESGHSRAYSTWRRRPPGENSPGRPCRCSDSSGGYLDLVPTRGSVKRAADRAQALEPSGTASMWLEFRELVGERDADTERRVAPHLLHWR